MSDCRYHADTVRYARYARIACMISCLLTWALDSSLSVFSVRHHAFWPGAVFAVAAIFFACYGFKIAKEN